MAFCPVCCEDEAQGIRYCGLTDAARRGLLHTFEEDVRRAQRDLAVLRRRLEAAKKLDR
jgi:hypothetical protein